MLTTSKRLLRKKRPEAPAGAREDRYNHLVAALGPWPDTKAIPLMTILKHNGFEDCLWAFRAVPRAQVARRDRMARLLACDFAEHVQHVWAAQFPDDDRPTRCIRVVRRFAMGRATSGELDAARRAAWGAVWMAARAAKEVREGKVVWRSKAEEAARAAAETARTCVRGVSAMSRVRVTADAACGATARAKEREWQIKQLKKRLRAT